MYKLTPFGYAQGYNHFDFTLRVVVLRDGVGKNLDTQKQLIFKNQ